MDPACPSSELIGLAELHIQRMPCIFSRGRKMSAWTDIKEILFPSCSNKHCIIVLDVLKHALNYPETEIDLKPCSAKEHLMFLRQFRVVPAGTLLVNVGVIVKQIKDLWRSVLLKHCKTQNPNSRRCYYAVGDSKQSSRSSRIHLSAKDEIAEGDICLTFFRFVNPKHVKGTMSAIPEFINVPAIKWKSNNNSREIKHDNEAYRSLIPLFCLSECLPELKDKLIETAGNHLIHGPETSKHLLTRCCTDQEGRAITRWFHKLFGWGGSWQHLTSRDLLVSWEEFLARVGPVKTSLDGKVIESGAERKTPENVTSNDEARHSKIFEECDYFEKASTSSQSTSSLNLTCLSNLSVTDSIGNEITGADHLKPFHQISQQKQPKKRQRIKSPREPSKVDVNQTILCEIQKNNSALPDKPSTGSTPVIRTAKDPLNTLETKRDSFSCSLMQYPNSSGQYLLNDPRKQQASYCSFYQRTLPNNIMFSYRPIMNPTRFLGHQLSHKTGSNTQYTSIIRQGSPVGKLTANTPDIKKGLGDENPKESPEISNSNEQTTIKVINQHDIVGSILKSAQVNENHFKACAAVQSRDPRIKSIPVHKSDFRAIPFDTRKLSSNVLSKQFRKEEGDTHNEFELLKEKEIMDRVSANPFSQSVESLKANRTLYMKQDYSTSKDQKVNNTNAGRNRLCKTSESTQKQPTDDKLCVKGESVFSAMKELDKKESKSETEISAKWRKAFNPKRSSSESAVSWKVKSNDLKLTFTKLVDGVHELKNDQNAKLPKPEMNSQPGAEHKVDFHVVKTDEVKEVINALLRNPKPKEKKGNSVQEENEMTAKETNKLQSFEKKPLSQRKETNDSKQIDRRHIAEGKEKKKQSKHSEAKKASSTEKYKKKDDTAKNDTQNFNIKKREPAFIANDKTKSLVKNKLNAFDEIPADKVKFPVVKSILEDLSDKAKTKDSDALTTLQVSKREPSRSLYETECQNEVAIDDKLEIDRKSQMLLEDCNKSLNASSKNGDINEEDGIRYCQFKEEGGSDYKEKIHTIMSSNNEILREKMAESDVTVSKGPVMTDKRTQSSHDTPHPKKKWMNDFLCNEIEDQKAENVNIVFEGPPSTDKDESYSDENVNIVFEDPLSTDKDESNSDDGLSSSDNGKDERHPYRNTEDSGYTEKYGCFDEDGSYGGKTSSTESMQQKLDEMYIEQKEGWKKHTPVDELNTKEPSSFAERKEETTGRSTTVKQRYQNVKINKHKVTKRKSGKNGRVLNKIPSDDKAYYASEKDKCSSDQNNYSTKEKSCTGDSVAMSTSVSERNLKSKKIKKSTKMKSSKSSMKASKHNGNVEYNQSQTDRKNTLNRKVKTSNSRFVRRSTRFSRSPGSYAENSSSSDQESGENQTEESMSEKEKTSKLKTLKKNKVSKSKLVGKMQAVVSKEKRSISSEEVMQIKSTHTQQFIKEQEIIFSIIKSGSVRSNKTSVPSSSMKHGEAYPTAASECLVPELSREDCSYYDMEPVPSDTKVMPKLEPEVSLFDTDDTSTSHNQSLNAAYSENDVYESPRKQNVETSQSREKKIISFLPELKKSFLVNTCGGSILQSVNSQIQKEDRRKEKLLDLHEIRYENVCDDDGKTNGGLIHHTAFVIPFVLMNGYKCVTVTDAAQMFINCKPKCHKPKAVMQKHRSLFRTFCTWEQVYTLDLLYVRKGRRIKTGDMLLRWDILLANIQDVLDTVKAEHLPPNKNKHKCRYDPF